MRLQRVVQDELTVLLFPSCLFYFCNNNNNNRRFCHWNCGRWCELFRVSRNENWKTRTFKVSCFVTKKKRLTDVRWHLFFTINDRILPFRLPWLCDDFITKEERGFALWQRKSIINSKMVVKVEIQFCGGWGRCTLFNHPFSTRFVSTWLDLSVFLLHHVLRHHVV